MDERKTKDRLVELSQGTWVERDVLNICEKVQEYDSRLKVQYCDQAGSISDSPYRLMELCRDGIWRQVFSIWKLDETVLERIYAADTQKFDILDDISRKNAKAKENQLHRYEEERKQVVDWITSYLKSRKGRWSFKDAKYGNRITLDDTPGTPVKVKHTD